MERVVVVDDDFWKRRYQSSWKEASTKEEKVKEIIEKECGCTCEFTGLGAGKTEFLGGSAKSRGFTKGGSDLHVKETNIYIEVTGPNVDYVGKTAGLWVRPDKINHAISKPANDNWVVHVLKKDFYMRAIHLDGNFEKDYKNGIFRIVNPWIKDLKGTYVQETYVEIPAGSEHVVAIEVLLDAVKTALR